MHWDDERGILRSGVRIAPLDEWFDLSGETEPAWDSSDPDGTAQWSGRGAVREEDR